MAIFDFLGSIIKPVTDLVGRLVTTDKDRGEIEQALETLQNQAAAKLLEYESKLLEAQSSIIVAEAKGESFLQRNWRPVTMLAFVTLLILTWLGVTSDHISESLTLELMSIVKLGLGGYVIGRSGEKIVKSVAPSIISALKK